MEFTTTQNGATTMSKHAVFMNRTHRVSARLDWNQASDLWEKLDSERRANGDAKPGTDGYVYYELRSMDDPKYRDLPFLDLTRRKLSYVKLNRVERSELLDIGRAAGDLQGAADAMFNELAMSDDWQHLDAVTISDYTWAAANFCFPHEAKYL